MKLAGMFALLGLVAIVAVVCGIFAVWVGHEERKARLQRRKDEAMTPVQHVYDDVDCYEDTQEYITEETMKAIKVSFYKDAIGEWRWHVHSSNGKLIACGGEGYKTKASATKGWNALVKRIVNGLVVED